MVAGMPTTTKQRTRQASWPARVGLVRLSDGETGTDGFHRSWIMLFPEGKFEHEQYGELNFTKARLATIKRQFDSRVRHIDIALDANHDQDKATGWLEQLALREPGRDPKTGEATPAGLWGLVRWTPLGLRYLKDQIYRYFSPEFGPWKDPETGKQYRDVLIGGGLTNRPFLKRMSAVQLAEISTRPWSQVDKDCLCDTCFLDPANRRLPIYEGAGPKDAKGRYTQRGKLNLNGMHAALAAIHGGRTGKPMTGLPSGVEAKLQRLLERYGGSGKDSGSATSAKTASEGGSEGRRMAGKQGATKTKPVQKSRREREQDLEALLFGEGEEMPEAPDEDETDDNGAEEEGDEGEELSDSDAGMTFAAKASDKKGGKASKAGKGSAAGDAEDAADGGGDEDTEDDGEQYDDSSDMPDDYSMDDGEEEDDTPTEGTSGRASSKKVGGHSTKTMSKKASEGDGGMTLREMQSELMRLREESAQAKYQLYEAAVDKTLEGWAKGHRMTLSEGGKPSKASGPVALSRTFREAYRYLMLKEAITLTERQRGGIRKLIELALHDAVVDLSTRGSSFDQESRRTLRSSNDPRKRGPQSPAQSDALQEHAVRLSESRFNKPLEKLSEAEKLQVFTEAAEEVEYR